MCLMTNRMTTLGILKVDKKDDIDDKKKIKNLDLIFLEKQGKQELLCADLYYHLGEQK